ncbi:hypothetical protein DFH94DRAFT_403588 [Russula ochroleuca]|uniref:Uncharacterized protein n=1 Tax=Russula ochroleuca TaxID=152965 RepID=A0A9P5MYA5_9AGAM|nr:hypothetical protein DFH94DRAFT_403588 [Russula ochroleuca]
MGNVTRLRTLLSAQRSAPALNHLPSITPIISASTSPLYLVVPLYANAVTAKGRSSDIDAGILGWTISALGDDDSLESFLEAIPGFFNLQSIRMSQGPTKVGAHWPADQEGGLNASRCRHLDDMLNRIFLSPPKHFILPQTRMSSSLSHIGMIPTFI